MNRVQGFEGPRGQGERQGGFALIMTLWILVFLTIVAMNFTLTTRWSVAGTTNFKNETEAYYLALSGYDLAVQYLMNDGNPSADFVDSSGNLWVDSEHPPITGRVSLYNGEVEIKITDEQSRINVNRMTAELMTKLFTYAQVDTDSQKVLIDSLLDWTDADEFHRPKGAESDYYKQFGYKSKNGPLDTIDELLLVKGFSPEILYGSETTRPITPFLTTVGPGSYNINTVDQGFMRLLGVSEVDIENVMRSRTKEVGGLTSVPQNLIGFGFNTTTATYLRIEVTSEAHRSGIKYLVTAVVKRGAAAKGVSVSTISWRERVIYS